MKPLLPALLIAPVFQVLQIRFAPLQLVTVLIIHTVYDKVCVYVSSVYMGGNKYLMDFLQDEEMNVEYEVASNNTLFFDRYIGSRRHAPRVPKCDPETGEVIEKKES